MRILFEKMKGKDAADYLDFVKIERLEEFMVISKREKLLKRQPRFAVEVRSLIQFVKIHGVEKVIECLKLGKIDISEIS